jgi:hypothetical protein
VEASVRYINPPCSGDVDDGGFKPAVCFRAREYAHCVVNEDSGIHVIKVPVRDFDHAPVVLLKGEAYPTKRAAKMMLDFTERTTARRDITQRASELLRGVLDGSETTVVDAPTPPTEHPKGAPTTLIAAICAELDIDPPVARRLLRKAGLAAPYTDEAQIRAVLKKEI